MNLLTLTHAAGIAVLAAALLASCAEPVARESYAPLTSILPEPRP